MISCVDIIAIGVRVVVWGFSFVVGACLYGDVVVLVVLSPLMSPAFTSSFGVFLLSSLSSEVCVGVIIAFADSIAIGVRVVVW
eukprot:11013512-Karenia_brevis.AAC.1